MTKTNIHFRIFSLLALFAFYGSAIQAATFVVSNTSDDIATSGSLRWAIDQANTTAGPDVINITATGTLTVTGNSSMVITEAVTINGNSGFTIDMPFGTIFSSNGPDDLVFNGLKLLDSALSFNNVTGFSISNCTSLSITNCELTNTSRGIVVFTCEDVQVHSNTFNNCGNAGSHFSAEFTTITENTTSGRSLDFYANTITSGFNGYSFNNIENASFSLTGTTDIVLPTSDGRNNLNGRNVYVANMDNLTFNGFDFSGISTAIGQKGLEAANCDNLTVENCTINAQQNALTFNQCDTLTVNANLLDRATATSNTFNGISVSNGSNASITNNSITAYGLQGGQFAITIFSVLADINGDRLDVNGNTFSACGSGIRLSGMDDLIISNTLVSGTTEVHLTATDGRKECVGTNLQLENCDNIDLDNIELSLDNGGTNVGGVALSATGCANLTVQNCMIFNRQQGLIINNSDTLLIHNNTLTRTLAGNTLYGISAFNGSNATITSNTLTGQGIQGGQFGIGINGVDYDSNGDRLDVRDNTFVDCGNGVYLANMPGLIIDETLVVGVTEVHLPDTDGRKTCWATNLELNTCRDVVIEDFDFSYDGSGNNGSDAFKATNCHNLTVLNNTTNDRYRGFTISGCDTLVVQGNILSKSYTGNSGNGLSITNGNNASVVNNSFTSYGLQGGNYTMYFNNVSTDTNGDRLNVTGNTFTTCGNGVYFQSMDDLQIHETAMVDTEVLLPNGDGRIACTSTLFGLNNCDNLVLENFNFSFDNGSGNIGGAVLEANSCDNLTIQNNTSANRFDGINVVNCNGVILDGNILTKTFNGNTVEAVDIINGSDITITNNSFTNYGQVGNRYALNINNVTDNGNGRLDVSGNAFNTCSHGVQLNTMDNLHVDAIADGNTEVHLANNDGRIDCNGIAIRMNNCDNQALTGFDVSFSATGGTGNGLYLNGSDNVTVTDLIANNRGIAVQVENANDVSIDNQQSNTGLIAVRAVNMNGLEITNSIFNNFTPSGNSGVIYLQNIGLSANTGERLNMVGNNFGNSNNTGIYLHTTDDIIISDGSVTGTHITIADQDSIWSTLTPIHALGSHNMEISKINLKTLGNTPTGTGIYFQDSDNATISDVSITGRGNGLNFHRNTGATINNCLFQENNNGIFASGLSNDLTALAVANSNFICNANAIYASANATIDAGNNFWGASDGSSTDTGSGDTYIEATNVGQEGVVNNSTTFLASEDANSPIGGQRIFNELAAQLTNGQTVTSVADSTDYESVNIGESLIRQFRIANNGLDTMFITGITSTDAQFAVTNVPAYVLCMDTLSFDVTFTPTSESSVTSTIAIENVNCYNTEFVFDVAGVGFQPCDIVINLVTTTAETCTDAADGTLTVTSTCVSCDIGASDIRYSIDGTNFLDNGGVFTNLEDGTYTVTVRDVNDITCETSSSSHVVAAGSGPCCDIAITSVSPTDEVCVEDGEIDVIATCTTCVSIEYSIDDFTNSNATGDFTGLSDGSYTVKVRDSGDPTCNAEEINVVVGASTSPDTDSDLVPDCADLDDDNDGILDIDELECNTAGIPALTPITITETFGAGPDPGPANPDVTGSYVYSTLSNTPDGYYSIATDTDPYDDFGGTLNVWAATHGLGDNTGDNNGYFLLVNGSAPGQEAYRKTFNVVPNSDFTVSIALLNLAPSLDLKPNLSLRVENSSGGLLAVEETGNLLNATWDTYTLTGMTSTDFQVDLVVVSNTSSGVGNDYGIDDVSITYVPLLCDADGDNIPDSEELDSDDNGCYDVAEAGYDDPDNDGILGTSPVSVDAQGLVVGEGGYTGASNEDAINPVVICPVNIEVTATSAAGEIVNFADATATDNCSVSVAQSAGLASGATFPIGENTVTYTATDASGNTAECSFTVTVSCDLEITNVSASDETCPGEDDGTITIVATCTTCTGGIQYSIDGFTSFNTDGLFTDLPDATYTVEVRDAGNATCNASAAGNVINAGTDTEAPTISCNDITVDLDAAGSYTLTTADLEALAMGSSDDCSGFSSLTITSFPSSFDCNDVAGQANNLALAFDETDDVTGRDYVQSESSVGIIGQAPRTMELWIRMDETNVFNEHIANWGNPDFNGTYNNGSSFGIYQTNGSELMFYTHGIEGTHDKLTGFVFDESEWYHVAVTYDGTNQFSVFVNGNHTPNSPFTLSTPNTVDGPLILAARPDLNTNTHSTIDLDEVRIWDYQRTQSEIQADMNLALNGNESGLVLYYDMEDDGPGTTNLVDKTANNNDGILINMDTATDWIPSGSPVFSGGTPVVLEVTDAAGNTSTSTCAITVTVNTNLTVATTATDETCMDNDDGQIAVTVTGGTGPYTFTATRQGDGSTVTLSGTSPQTFMNLIADDYIIGVEDNGGCSGTTTDNVGASATPCCDIAITSVTATDEVCPGADDGTITVVASCTACTGGIQYSIDGFTTFNTDGLFTSLADATYTVNLRDSGDHSCAAEMMNVIVAAGSDSEAPVPDVSSGSALGWEEAAIILASDAAVGNQYGHSVSVSGDYAIVGAPGNGDGAAYIFKKAGTSWSQEAKIESTDLAAGDGFGFSVAISGDYAIAGAHNNDDAGSGSGSAYIFMRTGTTWSQQAKLLASDAAAGDAFGIIVNISGDDAIVSGLFNDDAGTNSGSAYIFKRTGTNWNEEAKIVASDAASNDGFSSSLSISGDYAIVGSYANDDAGSNSGSAYIYKRSGTNWNEEAKIVASDAAFGDEFGRSVSISGDYVIVGAWLNDDTGSGSGSAYIFKRDGINWNEEAKLVASDAASGDSFGWSSSISGDYAIVGGHGNDDAGNQSGSSYIFKRDGINWNEESKIIASNASAGDSFGFANSISGNNVIVGAWPANNSTGAAYIFELGSDMLPDVTAECSVTPATPTATDNCTGVVNGTTTTTFPIITQGTTVVTWTYDDGNGNTTIQDQNIIIDDMTDPVITCPMDITVNNDAGVCEATNVALGTPTVTDNCNMSIVATNDAPAAFPVGMTTVTWTADDGNGQTSTCTQVVTVEDNEAPVAMCTDITVNLVDENTYNLTQVDIDAIGVNSTDNCSTPTYTITAGQTAFDCADVGSTVQVTLTATDDANNTSTCTAMVTVEDPNTVCCDVSIIAVTTTNEGCPGAEDGTLTVTATCTTCTGGVQYSIDGFTTFNTDGLFTDLPDATYTVDIRDAGDATCTDSSTGIVGAGTDTTLPTISCPSAIVMLADAGTCTVDGTTLDLGTVTADDNCEVASVTNDAPTAFPVGITTVTHLVTDGSGNTATCTQQVTVFEPQEIAGNGIDDDCDGETDETPLITLVPLDENESTGSCVSNTDCCANTFCYGMEYTPDYTGTLANYTTGFIIDCGSIGNPVVFNQSCVMTDNSLEIEDCAGQGGVLYNSSGNNGSLAVTSGTPVIIHQICFEVPVNEVLNIIADDITGLTMSIDITPNITITENPTFGGSQVAGNTPPVITMGTIDACYTDNATAIADAISVTSATDDCSANVTITAAVVGDCATMVRVYATDHCGLVDSVDYNTTIDGAAPVITGMPSVTVIEGCDVAMAPAPLASVASLEALPGGMTIDDLCTDDASLMINSSDSSTGSCPIVLTRVYTISDACGNSSTFEHTIHINDTEKPNVNGSLDDTMIEGCSVDDIPAAMTTVAGIESLPGGLTITDNCDDATLTVTMQETVIPGCTIQVFRIYSITDACQNTSTLVHQLFVTDSTAPELMTGAIDACYATEQDAVAASIAATTYNDNCAGPLEYSSYTTSSCPTFISIIGEDACGNRDTVTYSAQITDGSGPTEVGGPVETESTIQSALDALLVAPPVFEDNCENVLTPSPVVQGGTFQDGDCTGTITFSYDFTDCAGVVGTWTYTYNVNCQSVNVRMFLQGAYTTGTNSMDNELNFHHLLPGQDKLLSSSPSVRAAGTFTPFGHPYQVAPWNYTGTTGGMFGDASAPSAPTTVVEYPEHVVDWVLVSVRENGIAATDNVWTCAGWLHTNGDVTYPETCPTALNIDSNNDYYIVVEHRNHLVALDTATIADGGTYLDIDFRYNNSYIAPFRKGQKEMEPGVFGLYNGNGRQNAGRAAVNSADRTVWRMNQNKIGYFNGDYDLNVIANSADETFWKLNQNTTSGVQF